MGLHDGWVFRLSRHMPGPWGHHHLQPNAATWNPVAWKSKNLEKQKSNPNSNQQECYAKIQGEKKDYSPIS